MNELLQKHGCSNVFTVPEGLRELMSDITREVLRDQPAKIFDFIANYLSVLLITREHGIMAVKILDDLCDCKPSVSEHLLELGFERKEAEMLSQVIKEEVEEIEPEAGKEKVREIHILKKILTRTTLDEDMSTKVCQVARNAYRDYWYRKKLMEKSLNKLSSDEPWEIAAQHTLEIYKRTKPSFNELTRASVKIQAAYRGYHIRRNVLRNRKPRKRTGPELPGSPLQICDCDIAGSREIDLGPVTEITVKEDNVGVMFQDNIERKLGLQYDPTRTITHIIDDEEFLEEKMEAKSRGSKIQSKGALSSKSLMSRSQVHPSSADRQSRVDATSKKSEVVMDPRGSRTPSRVDDISHHSRQPSLSFAQTPAEVVPQHTDEDEGETVPEELTEGGDFSEHTPLTEGETQDIPELITEYTDGEESVPPTSAPTSAPETDVEDTVGEVTSGEDEA